MNRIYSFFIGVIIVASFVVAPLAQSWGDSYGIAQQKMLFESNNVRNAVALTNISETMVRPVRFWNYGKLRAEAWRGPNKVDVNDLIGRWDQYDVYYAGWIYYNPSAVMFDPKGDDRKLISDKWIPIKDQVELSMLVRYMRSNYHFHPVLWRVLDPDNHFYGYIYSARQDVVMKVVDDQTMWVDDLPLPPYDPINFRPRSFGPVLEAI